MGSWTISTLFILKSKSLTNFESFDLKLHIQCCHIGKTNKFILTILQIIRSCLFEAFAPVFLWLVEISPHKFHELELGMNFVPSFMWVLSKKMFLGVFYSICMYTVNWVLQRTVRKWFVRLEIQQGVQCWM